MSDVLFVTLITMALRSYGNSPQYMNRCGSVIAGYCSG